MGFKARTTVRVNSSSTSFDIFFGRRRRCSRGRIISHDCLVEEQHCLQTIPTSRTSLNFPSSAPKWLQVCNRSQLLKIVISSIQKADSCTAIQFELSNPPTDAVSSLQFAPNSPTRLLVSSWDKHVYLYETHGEEAGGRLIEKYEHRAPVLDVCFGADDNEAFSAGMDWQVKRYGGITRNPSCWPSTDKPVFRINLETGEQTVLSTHNAPVKSVVYSKEHCQSRGHLVHGIYTLLTLRSSIAGISVMGLDAPFPLSQQP
jgi:WD40 repeat protein